MHAHTRLSALPAVRTLFFALFHTVDQWSCAVGIIENCFRGRSMAMKFSLCIFYFKFYFVIFSPLRFMFCLCCLLFRNYSFGGCMCVSVYLHCAFVHVFFWSGVCRVELYHTIFFSVLLLSISFSISFFGDLFLCCFLLNVFFLKTADKHTYALI